MIAQPEHIDVILPFGEMLRTFLEQPFIAKAELKDTLRSRGIFVGSSSKEVTIPIAGCCLLSPHEFDRLKECQTTKEDNPKTFTRYLDWGSQDSLIEAVPSSVNFEGLLGEASGYCKMVGNPTFIPVGNNPNHVRVDFEIERQDLSKSWAMSSSVFKGSVELEKVFEGKNVKVLLTYSSDETKQLNLNVSKALKDHFEGTGRIPSGSAETRILFNDFTNEQRVHFLLSFTGENNTNLLQFQDIVDLDACPDSGSGILPDEIKWMDHKVNELKLKGTKLQETVLIRDKRFHKHLHVHKIDTKFEFAYHAAAGACTICFEFAGFLGSPGRAAEFETTISALALKSDYQEVSKNLVKEHIYRALEFFTYQQYRKSLKFSPQVAEPINEPTVSNS